MAKFFVLSFNQADNCEIGLEKVALFPGVKRIFSWSSLEMACCMSQLVSWERTGLLCRYELGKTSGCFGLVLA